MNTPRAAAPGGSVNSAEPDSSGVWRSVTGGAGAIWVVAVALGLAALVLFLALPHPATPAGVPFVLPWPALAAGFLLAEVAVVHYDYRREAHSFSMSELPLVFGLFFAAPRDLVLGAVVGTALALVVHRRQTGMKLLFNVGHVALGACLAVVIFRAVAGDAPTFEPSSWVAALLATVATSTLSTGAITVAISLSERRLEFAKVPEQLALALLATVGSASLALMGVGVAWDDPAAALLMVVPVATLFLAYRGYVLKRQERNSLEFLYHCARTLDETPDLASAMARILRSACDTFRAELAEVALVSQQDSSQLALVVTTTREEVQTTRQTRMDEISGLLHAALQSPVPQILRLDPPVPGPHGHALRQVMTAPLRSESHTLGALLVGNRLGATGAFKAGDLRLLQTLATQVSVSLEKGRLARTLTETAQRADRERANALVLQRGILPPPPPRVPGASFAVRYVPGAAGMEVGGDWYDVMQLPHGDVGAAIGDVVGHDVEAAARMGQARSALRAYANEGHAPGVVMERLNRLLAQTDPDFIGTCCYLSFSPANQTVTLVSAGHPPPLLLDADGRPVEVTLEANLPLGVDETRPYAQATLPMPPGATLVLYTDGLVESRVLPLDVGLARIAQIPQQTARGDLETLADHFLHQIPPGQSGDDLTLLLLRNQG